MDFECSNKRLPIKNCSYDYVLYLKFRKRRIELYEKIKKFPIQIIFDEKKRYRRIFK